MEISLGLFGKVLGIAPATFPAVLATAQGRTADATSSFSHAITLPSGIEAGDLLVAIVATDGFPTLAINTGVSGTNWNQLTQATNGNVVSSQVYWKIAEGGDALTVTTDASEQSSHISYRIGGASTVSGTSANGSSSNSDPPLHTPAGGSKKYLWIATRAGDSTVLPTVAPADFIDLITQAATGTAGASIASAVRELEAASLNPGAFTSTSEQWVCFTIAVEP